MTTTSHISESKGSSGCQFCSSKVKNFEFAGNRDFAAIYNRAPILPGHSLVIPRRHVSRLNELTEGELCGLFSFARSVTALLCDVMRAESFDWTLQEGEPAGQSVAHVHLHVIPRWESDLPNPGDWYPELEKQRQRGSSYEPIDSKERPYLTTESRDAIVSRLREEAQKRLLRPAGTL